MTDERIGQQFGNYQLVRLLGQGGFADVYLGEHRQLKSLAAIKVLYTRLNNELRESFLNEARILARLNHPHIIHTLEFGLETDGVPYLAMDYASQGTVRQRHPNGSKVPLEKVVGYVQQVADALQYAHDQKLIHRDLKPDNILIGEHNGLLLSDFGVAIVSQTTSRSLTAEKSIVGTMSYMAPEQLQGKAQRASDQYSLGIIVYEWLCGTRPFHGTVIEVFTQHVSMRPAPLRDHVPELSTTVEQVVLKALEKDPAQRFASVRDFAAAFAQASRGEIPAFIGEHTVRAPLSLPDASAQSALSGRVVVPPTLLASTRFPAAQAAFETPASPYPTSTTPSSTTAPEVRNPPASGRYPTLTTPSSTTAPDEYNSLSSGSYAPMPAPNTTPPGLYASASAMPLPPTQLAPYSSAEPELDDPAPTAPLPVYTPPTQLASTSVYVPPTQLAPSADYTPPAPFALPSSSLPPTQLAPSAGSVPPASGFLPPISTIDRPVKTQRLSTGKIVLLVALIALLILGGGAAGFLVLHRAGDQGNAGIASTSNNGGQGNAPGTSGNAGSGNNGSQSNGSSGNSSTPQPTATTSSAGPTATSGPNPTATTAPKPTATSAPKPTATPTPKPSCSTHAWTATMVASGGTGHFAGRTGITTSGNCSGKIELKITASVPTTIQLQICYGLNTTNCSSRYSFSAVNVWVVVATGKAKGTTFYINGFCSSTSSSFTVEGNSLF